MSQKRNIAIIAGQLVVGGAERQLYLWLSHLDRDRFQPVVVTLHPGHDDHWEGAIGELGIGILRVPCQSRVERVLQITRLLLPVQPILIHGWHLFASPYAGAVGKLLRVKVSLGSLRSSFQAYVHQPAAARLTEMLTDTILVNSEAAGRQLVQSRKWPGKKVRVVQNAVEDGVEDRTQARGRISQEWDIPATGLWIGALGRFDASKQFDRILDLAAYLERCGEAFHLLLIGYGEGIRQLRERMTELEIQDRVTLVGPDPDARRWLSALDIFCFLSMDEGLPNAVMEAAAAGVAIIAWRMPFLEELLEDHKSALLIEPGDMTLLGSGTRMLIRDDQLRYRLGRAAQEVMRRKFSVDAFVQRMTAVYEGLLDSPP